jgi:DNA gyrase/topoisomerase IV subunit B
MPKEDYEFKELSDKDWLLLRPQNIIGSVQEIKQSGFNLKNGKFQYEDYYIVPALLKIINEIIDNSVDVFIKSEGKFATKIDITMTDITVKVKDNGSGIPVKKQGGVYIPEMAWGRPRAGTNFDDKKNVGSLGMNGVGSYATAVFSKEFIGTTCDGSNKMVVKFTNNLEKKEISAPTKCKVRGTTVEFKPDLARFGLSKITEIYKNAIKQRLMHIAYSYQEITFKFNGEVIKSDPKSYFSKFGDNVTLFQGKNFSVAFLPNATDDFRFFSYINGLYASKGGTQIDYFLDKTLPLIRQKIARKYKDIKNGDIKNKITMIVIFKGFKEPKYDSQSKEMFTSPASKITEHIGKIDFEKWGDVLYKNKAIIDDVIEIYKIKEAYKEKKELEKLKGVKKKIKSEKYYPPTEKRKYLMICEGASASGGLMPALGRKEVGYYELKGKPLNAYDKSQQKFRANKELSELYQIILTEGYEYAIFATDQDLDGFTIRGLLIGFFNKYLPNYLTDGQVGMLQTPIMAELKNDMPVKWVYDLDKSDTLSGHIKYFKGLGSWTEKGLKSVVKKDGLSKMIEFLEWDENAQETIDAWLNSKRADDRKEMIMSNNFDLIKL